MQERDGKGDGREETLLAVVESILKKTRSKNNGGKKTSRIIDTYRSFS
jgi:hypothetical protein